MNYPEGFYSNDSSIRFLDKRNQCLSACLSFCFSVSFIKKAGLLLIYPQREEALKRGAKGKIVTSTYKNFTDIPSLERFLSLEEKYPDRFSCRLERNSFGDDGFHTKGYLFSFSDHKEILVGSSNLTYFALLKNKEWNVSVITDERSPLYTSIQQEFDSFFDKTYPLTRDIIKKYHTRLAYSIESWDRDRMDTETKRPLRPNLMQVHALKEIKRYRDRGADKALVVAATGSGKTYLAAFDAFNRQAKKLLFVVHKDIILKEARQTFKAVFQTSRTYGIYTGETKELDADFIFASNRIRSENLNLFAKDEFDYIVIDEVHHASANTYQKIIGYFKPQFLLGLTATPERRDGQDVYSLFGNNVPYDLRLRDALRNNLVVPFRYYGIKDSLLDYRDDKSSEGIRRIISQVSSLENCSFVKEQVLKYAPKNTKLRCIGFCRNVEHARLRAVNREQLGFNTAYLSGENSTGERMKILNDLQDDTKDLNRVFAVDILNEGIDVPSINRVLFLRPTQSPTIFIQQLGRGLRKYEGKEYLTVLDFIANSYNRSVQIALALGSLSKRGYTDKLALRNNVITDYASLGIPDLRIHFDEESQKEILDSISRTNLNSFAIVKQDYENFKRYLNLNKDRYPMPSDFLSHEADSDLLRFRHKKSFESYYDFLLKAEEGNPFLPIFSQEEIRVLDSLSFYLPLTRDREYRILRSLLSGSKTISALRQEASLSPHFSEESFRHAIGRLNDRYYFTRPSSHIRLVKEEKDGIFSLNFDTSNPEFVLFLSDLIRYGLSRYESEFQDCFTLAKPFYPYSVVSFAAALNSDNLYIRPGVFNTPKGKVITINLNKDFQKEERLKYKDRFLSDQVIQWESRTKTTRTNKRGLDLRKDGEVHVLVRKVKQEDGITRPFIYLGKAKLTNPRISDNPGQCLLFDLVLEEKRDSSLKFELGIEDI